MILKQHRCLYCIVLLLMAGIDARSQAGMAINSTGASANASAVLDVSSTTQGVLIPRMLSGQRTSIASPATGLLVYQIDSVAGFYFYNGSAWTSLSGSSGTAGGDLTGSYPNPTIANTASAGAHIVTAIDSSSSVIGTKHLGTGTATSSNFLRGDATWATPPSARYFIPMGSNGYNINGSTGAWPSGFDVTTSVTGATDSVAIVGMGAATNQWVNINGGSYIDPSVTFPYVYVPVPISATVTSFSFFFKFANQPAFIAVLGGTYTLNAQLYYSPTPSGAVIGSDQFYPVTGASVSFNMTTLCGICVYSESLYATATGLSFPLSVGSRLLILVSYSVSIAPSPSPTPLSGWVDAAVGMQ